jgi:hypothetical protein
LWLAEREGSGLCLIRLLDFRLADLEFRRAVDDLSADIARFRPPRVLPIVHHEWMGDHYYIEYGLNLRTQSVPEYFAQTHWLQRLRFVKEVTTVYRLWREHLPAPLGLHGGRIVACRAGNQWLAHLAPCPQIKLASPYDLSQANSDVLAAVAPERLRGVAASGTMEDVYATGALVLQALGMRPPAGADAPARLEAQARGSFAEWDFEHSDIEKTLWQIPLVKERLLALSRMVLHCAAFSPAERPPGLLQASARQGDRTGLEALDHVLGFANVVSLSAELDGLGRPADALLFAEWALACKAARPEEQPRIREMAADLCARVRLPARELHHVELLLKVFPWKRDLVRRRMQLRYDAYLQKKASGEEDALDPEGDWLLAELEGMCAGPHEHLEQEERAWMKEDRLRAAMIYGRRGQVYERARQLWEATRLEFADIESLFLYGLSLRDLESRFERDGSSREELAATMSRLVREVEYRFQRLTEAGAVAQKDVKEWTERFQSLRPH